MSLLKFFIVLTIVAFASGRLSYYYANQGLNYHPPWDKYTGAYNGPNSESAVNNCNYTYNCPPGYVPRQNTNYVPTYTPTCPIPAWLSQSGTPYSGTALTLFNTCCYDYSVCLQTCGVRKAFCDGQFEGCTYTACNPTRILRPGDRLYCRGLSSCISSYNARPETCSTFVTSQNASCACVPAGSASNSLSASYNFLPSASPSPFTGKRQANSESSTTTQSYSNSASTTNSYSPSNVPRVSPNLYNFQHYFVRQIPQWNLYYNRCPPNFANYVAVFTDQDQDDIGYYGAGQGAAGSLNSWMF